MSIQKNLTVTVENPDEGVSIHFKTVSALGKTKVSISGDPAVYEKKDIEEALKEIEAFLNPETGEPGNSCCGSSCS